MSVGKFGIRYRYSFRLGAAHPPCHLKGKQEKGARWKPSPSAPY